MKNCNNVYNFVDIDGGSSDGSGGGGGGGSGSGEACSGVDNNNDSTKV